MKTLEHEIRDVLSGKDLEELRLLEEFIDYAAENYVITEEDEQYLAELAPLVAVPALGGLALGIGSRALLGGIIRNAPRIGQSILKNLKRGGQRAKVLARRLSRAAKRRGAIGAASGAAEDLARGIVDGHTGKIEKRGGSGPGVETITLESREDIEATPRFTETDREKIDIVPRAENDLDTANRKRVRMENIKKKIIDDEFNIRHEFNNFLIEENIELTEEEYDEAFDILFHYFVQDLNENILSTLYKGAKFVGRRVLAPGMYAYDAYEKYKKGDTRGALTSGAKAVASVTPIGAAASIAHDAYQSRKDIADVARQGYDYVRKSLFGKPKPSNQISQNKRKPSGLSGNPLPKDKPSATPPSNIQSSTLGNPASVNRAASAITPSGLSGNPLPKDNPSATPPRIPPGGNIQSSTPGNQVSVNRAASAIKPSGLSGNPLPKDKKAVRPTPGNSGRTATGRLGYMARRGNRAPQRALSRGPNKDWRSSVFDNQSSSGN